MEANKLWHMDLISVNVCKGKRVAIESSIEYRLQTAERHERHLIHFTEAVDVSTATPADSLWIAAISYWTGMLNSL